MRITTSASLPIFDIPEVAWRGTRCYLEIMSWAAMEVEQEIRSLVDDYRDQCLWYLRRDYYPRAPEEIRTVLDAIRRHGDQEAFRRARRIEQWLSHHSSATSA